MEKDRSSRIIAIVALLIAVVGVSLGFAAFSTTLTINAEADVKADASRFQIVFSKQQDQATVDDTETGSLAPDKQDGDYQEFDAATAKITGTTIDGLKATFQNGKGKQVAKYSFYVYNAGELNGYLKAVNFSEDSPTCEAVAGDNNTGASDSYLTTACSEVKLKITIGTQSYESSSGVINSDNEVAAEGEGIPVVVELSYDDTTAVDGDFKVDFGSITLNYSTTNSND